MAIRNSSGTHFPARLRFRLPNAVAAVVNVSTGESTPWNLRRIPASQLRQFSERTLSCRIEELGKSVRNAVEDKLAFDSGACYPAAHFESTMIQRVCARVAVTVELNSLFSHKNRHPQLFD